MAASKKRPDAFASVPALHDALAAFLHTYSDHPFVLAFSGGMDSCVLLDALTRLAPNHPMRLIHVHHGLQPEADAWAAFAKQTARRYGLPLEVVRVAVQAAGCGLEAAARRARYTAFSKSLQPHERLLTAHHQRDQAETVLLNLARGAGPRGLQGMRPEQIFSAFKKVGDPPLQVLRPLLNVPYSELLRYAQDQDLRWVEDPSNQDVRFLRNAIRQRWLPTLAEDVSHIEERLATAARWQAECADLLEEVAQQDLQALGTTHWRLPLERLASLSSARQKNVLRHWLLNHLEHPPAERHIEGILQAIIAAREDATPVLRWREGQLRRFQNTLYWVTRSPEWHAETPEALRPFRFQGCEPISTHALQPLQEAGLALKPLKKRFQALGVPPWLRPWWPVVVTAAGDKVLLGLDPATPCRVDFIAECGGMG
ncbi:tRNA(Ile)-lysidine synthase [Sulfurivirga caldicuralii]|uniref:tRNA(Ile)-lysidine synthase n=1 Tax=Sulfurivirga caldicuralii TaxID=364032 RepID=A0A1N6F8N2_9GAMM|nr:tRNA lysidine(34) synthetase TilS [Sulfurivirga caldicuralii]SIN91576.1 tRNA(Ile)-lysidine synthase [Sulfurivirga caldicuralii]